MPLTYPIGLSTNRLLTIENARIIDLVPTILHLFDVPVPYDVDGCVLKEIFNAESHLAKNKVRYRVPEKYEKEEEIKKRLKALGYMS